MLPNRIEDQLELRLVWLYIGAFTFLSVILFLFTEAAFYLWLILMLVAPVMGMAHAEMMDFHKGKMITHDGLIGTIEYEDGEKEHLQIAPCDYVYRFEGKLLCFHIPYWELFDKV